ncbi:MAG: hypothetical protein ACYSTZ_01005 [Planctomycetota bacterium]|jgi:hypothetical protein
MVFDVKGFMGEQYVPREAEVPITEPELKRFFNSDESPVWKVKGLTGNELGRANDVAEKNRDLRAIVEGVMSDNSKQKADALKKLVGISDDVPNDIAKRIEHLVAGSVAPKMDHQMAVKLCEKFPVEFYTLTTKIIELTGHGHVPGKPKPSGKAKKSDSR